jgi:hypothetical protein
MMRGRFWFNLRENAPHPAQTFLTHRLELEETGLKLAASSASDKP